MQTVDGEILLEEKWIEVAENGEIDKLRVLLSLGFDVNFEDDSGLTALTTAAENGYADYVSLLLFKGAHINQPDENGNTALLLAASNGCTDCLAVLLENGADIYIRDIGGRTALDLAEKNEDEESIGLLMLYYGQGDSYCLVKEEPKAKRLKPSYKDEGEGVSDDLAGGATGYIEPVALSVDEFLAGMTKNPFDSLEP